ncbi:hypothetical protein MXB_5088 [Myxobolus squamalis]|nr:hypothetical protein MXB_5088 [Myxobolus squamalis]
MDKPEEFYSHFPNLPFGITADVMDVQIDKLILDSNIVIDSVLSLHENEICYGTVVENIALHEAVFESKRNMIRFLLYVAPNPALLKANMNITEFCANTKIQANIFEILKKVRLKEKALTYENERYLNMLINLKKQLGFHLPKEERDELESIREKIKNLCKSYNGHGTALIEKKLFYLDELDGLSPDFINNLEVDINRYVVNLEDQSVHLILRYCKVTSTREKIQNAYNSRFFDSNSYILEQLVQLRHRNAQILGFQTYVDLTTEFLMAKNAKNVHDFLSSVASVNLLSFEKEKARLLYFKRKECEEMGIMFDGVINFYDFYYYQRIVEERDFEVYQNIISQYFPLEHVTKKILELYQSLLHLGFHEIKGVQLWNKDVRLFSVREKNSKKLIGYFYLDLFARKEKYDQISCFPLQSACETRIGYQLACAAMVANFKTFKADKKILLSHSEVFSFFLTESGMSVERDFVYAPSKMLENFAWEEEILKIISSHYISTS